MPAGQVTGSSALGFLTVVEHEQHGLVGGLLILTPAGRPLEFHCTAPVKPNRAQQILYGPTLTPYLYGEQIGQALVQKARQQPEIVLTDNAAVAALRDFWDAPLAVVLERAAGDAGAEDEEIVAEACAVRLSICRAAGYRLGTSARHAGDREKIVARLSRADLEVDLAEPFQRINEAIREAARAA